VISIRQLARRIAPDPSATTILLRIAAPVASISGLAWLAGTLANMISDFIDNYCDSAALPAYCDSVRKKNCPSLNAAWAMLAYCGLCSRSLYLGTSWYR